MFEKVNAVELCAVAGLAAALVASIVTGNTDIALCVGGALGGYAGGVYGSKGGD